MIISYHGCRQEDLAKLIAGHIEVSLGGGELGSGFYTTTYLHTAKFWAWTKKSQSSAVLEIAIADQDFFELDLLILDRTEAHYYRNLIKQRGETRTYCFDKDVILAPIVGDRIQEDILQFKWESPKVEQVLNSTLVKRRPL